MPGFYLLSAFLVIALIIDQETTICVLTSVSLKIQVYWINWRMKCHARKLHRQLVKLCKDSGFPEPGPFVFVDLWDRDR